MNKILNYNYLMALDYEKLQKNSTLRILYLFSLLYKKPYSRKELVEDFQKINVSINKTTVLKYINKLQDCDVKIKQEKIKNKIVYSIEDFSGFNFAQEELNSSSSLKKEIILNNTEAQIRSTMALFYKLALKTKDDDTKRTLIDFDYYSKINWRLVNKLKKHCKNHDLIELDYMINSTERKNIIIHADTVETQGTSNRLYLTGMFSGSNKFSKLPVDKIFMVKKVVESFVRYDFEGEVLTYMVSRKSFENTKLDEKEVLIELNSKTATIKRPLDDSFYMVQRLLYFCPDLYYVSDENIKNLLKQKLLEMKEMYEN